MSSAQVFELCKKCKTPSMMRIDVLGKVSYVNVVCECGKNKDDKKKPNSKAVNKYYGEK